MKKKSLKTLAASAALALSLSGTAFATEILLDIEGEISGDATNSEHKGEIEVLAWSWGGSNSGTFHLGGGGGAGKANFQDLSITKYIDSASATLFTYLANGDHFSKATLSVNKPDSTGKGSLFETTKLELEDILVTSYSTGGSGAEDRLTENITLNFRQFKLTNTPQRADGTAGTPIDFCWDIGANEPC